MRTRLQAGLAGIALVALTGSLMAGDKPDRTRFAVRAVLVGGQEVPALSTTGRGQFRAWVDTEANVIYWKLSYDGLEGAVTQAHVHFGQHSVNGGISFFLCSNLANPPAGTQACPAAGPAELEGTITPEAVIGPGPTATAAGQGIEPGAFAEIAAAIRGGLAYATVHTAKWPGGEIRGQLH